jgi:hypothetical protein
VLELALILTVGAGGITETMADCTALPPTPVQLRVNVVLAFTGGVLTEPEGNATLLELQSPPDTLQLVEFSSE